MSVLTLENLCIAFGDRPVVEGVGFSVHAGETTALVGGSGSGKTVTALSILKLLHGAAVSGTICFNGQDITPLGPTALRALRGGQIGTIFQEPMTALNPLKTIQAHISEAIRLHGPVDAARITDLLEQVGLSEARIAHAYPHELSGGQRQRAMIAMAIANRPKLLIADEPTTALDVTIQRQILDLLKSLQQQTGMAILLISHDWGVVRHMADHIVVMDNGQVVESGPRVTLLDQPQHPYTRALIDAVPPPLERSLPEQTPPVLSVEQLSVTYTVQKTFWGKPRSTKQAVRAVDFQLHPGETLGIVGESGSGKSSIMQGLLRLTPASGTVRFGTEDWFSLEGSALRRARAGMQVVFQDPFSSLSPRLSIGQILEEGLRVHAPDDRPAWPEMIADALRDVGLEAAMAHRWPHEFSGGQRQRIAIARALVLRPKVLILDEPTSALDRAVQLQVLNLLLDLQARYGLSYIFISHDLAVVRAVADKILVLHHGRCVEYASRDSIFNAPAAAYTHDLIAAALS